MAPPKKMYDLFWNEFGQANILKNKHAQTHKLNYIKTYQ